MTVDGWIQKLQNLSRQGFGNAPLVHIDPMLAEAFFKHEIKEVPLTTLEDYKIVDKFGMYDNAQRKNAVYLS